MSIENFKTTSLLSANHQIALLTPSKLTQNPISLFIERIWQKVLAWLSLFEKNNYIGLVAAFDRTSQPGEKQLGSLTQDNLLSYFKNFFDSDLEASPKISSCIEQLKKQIEAVAKKRAALIEGNPQKIQKFTAPLNEWIQDLENIALGEQKLILADDRTGNELFYLFSRSEEGIHLKIIGRGATMIDLSGIQKIAVRGKVKIPAVLHYRNIPLKIIRQLLPFSPLGNPDLNCQPEVNIAGIKDLLNSYQLKPLELNTQDDLATQSNNCRKVLQSVFKQISFNAQKENSDISRAKLRCKIYTLFSLLKEYRHTLSTSPKELHALSRMFSLCAQSLSCSHQKGVIDTEELTTLVQELTFIKQILKEAEKSSLPTSPHFTVSYKDIYSIEPLITKPASTLAIAPGQNSLHPHQLRTAANPPAFKNNPLILQPQRMQRFPPSSLFQVPQDANIEQIIQTIFAVDFRPYPYDPNLLAARGDCQKAFHDHLRIDGAATWENLSRDEAVLLSQKIIALSDKLANASQFHLSMDACIALLKMTYMIGYLDCHKIHSRNIHSSFKLLKPFFLILQGEEEKHWWSKRPNFWRNGFCITPHNLPTYLELIYFQEKISQNPHQNTQANTLEDNFSYLQAQITQFESILHLNLAGAMFSKECFSFLHGWIPPLSTPLLHAYNRFTISEKNYEGTYEISYGSSAESGTQPMFNRTTQEAISHDPRSSLKAFSDFIQTTSTFFEEKFLRHPDTKLLSQKDKEALEAIVERKKQYMQQASQEEEDFTEEQLTALLSLLREKRPHTELCAFMHTQESLLSHPQVRALIRLIFFHPQLLSLLKGESKETIPPQELIPKFFGEKIIQYSKKLEINPKDEDALTKLLFFLQMSHELKGIYEHYLFSTEAFFPINNLNEKLTKLKNQGTKMPLLEQELSALQLKVTLEQHEISQQQLYQVILDMQSLRQHLNNHPTISPADAGWIEQRYKQLLTQIDLSDPSIFSQEQRNCLLNALCNQQQLPLNRSPWRGSGFLFENDDYTMNLLENSILNKTSQLTHTQLPSHLFSDPLFKKSFPGLSLQKMIPALIYRQEKTTIYQFKDTQGALCQAEEDCGHFIYYKEMNGRMLQAAKLFTNTDLIPTILTQAFFTDPNHPETGYIFSDKGNLELELELEEGQTSRKITGIYDLRGKNRSSAYLLTSAQDQNSPPLKYLERFESKEHILLWTEKLTGIKNLFSSNKVTRIELPRYGLIFHLEGDRFICKNTHLAGYALDFNASLKDRKGFVHSILLTSLDRTRPSKLLVPPASTLISEEITPPPSPSGLALLIWLIRSAINRLIYQEPTFEAPPMELKIDSRPQTLDLLTIDLHPHTQELLYETDVVNKAGALIQQAFALGEDELAAEIIHALEIETKPLIIDQWIQFASKLAAYPSSAAVGLKLTQKLLLLIAHQENYQELRQKLSAVQVDLFKIAMKLEKKIEASLQLHETEWNKLISLVRKQDPEYYRLHIQPFLPSEGSIQFPTFYVDGKKANLPKIVAKPIHSRERRSKIQRLEEKIQPQTRLAIEKLTQNLDLINPPIALLFHSDILNKYFDAEKNLHVNQASQLLHQIIVPKQKELEQGRLEAHEKLEALLISHDPIEQLAFYAKEKRIATPTELIIALTQNDLVSLKDQGYLPQNIDLNALKKAIIAYYDLEIQLHLIIRSQAHLSGMLIELLDSNEFSRNSESKLQETARGTRNEFWKSQSSSLFELLSASRQYDQEKNPELLIFEAFHFITFREFVNPSQLELLCTILQNPRGITQAGTGSGKSAVLSILRALKKANGQNLVTYKVLPQLYQETLELMRARLEKTFKRKVYPFRFNLSLPMQDHKGNSIFIEIYQKMLETILNKGCILTDYKSLPLLEEKFWSLSQDLLIYQANKIEPTPLQLAHWKYLKRILILLQNKEDQLMDEFDEPSRPVHRIQMQIQEGFKIPSFMIDLSIDLYDRLLQEENLLLKQNLQADIDPLERAASIQSVAHQIAVKMADQQLTTETIEDYLFGRSEEALKHIANWPLEKKDALVFLKDQFYTYLPLALSYAGKSRYQRSPDGKKIITCFQGQPREAKFGNIIEEINFTIQDYRQRGVALPTARTWVINQIKDFRENPLEAENRFHDLIPHFSLEPLTHLSSEELERKIAKQILPAINERPEAVRFFLRNHLEKLRNSGWVASMTPQDIVSMSRAVSAMSATTGSGALHRKFQSNQKQAARIQEETIERLIKRAHPKGPILYHPANPMTVLKELPDYITAIIDGSGAFRECSPHAVAKALLDSNPKLKKVEYYEENGTLNYIGDPEAHLDAKGFYFSQAYTRGADQQLKPDAIALLTVNEQGKMEDLSQQEGRMRQKGQKILIAISEFTPKELRTLKGIIECKKANEEAQNKEEFFRGESQRLSEIIRTLSKQNLLEIDENDLSLFIKKFELSQKLFIQPALAEYAHPGDYHDRHQTITPRTCDPIQQLTSAQQNFIHLAHQLQLDAKSLQKIQYTEELRSIFPKQVIPLAIMQSQQLEIEEEREEQHELAIEEELEAEQETQTLITLTGPKVSSYLPRVDHKGVLHLAHAKINKAFDPKITFTENFLPLKRQDPLHKRTPFDERMSRIGVVLIHYDDRSKTIAQITIGDLLDDLTYPQDPLLILPSFRYDIRIGKVIWDEELSNSPLSSEIIEQPEFKYLIAQIKFMDGQISRYTEEELNWLDTWLNNNDSHRLRKFFEQKILQHRPEVRSRYRYSQIWNLFEKLVYIKNT